MKKLSIIIPVFNERQTLALLIDKVKAALLPNGWDKEIILVDDGSTDGSREILEKYQNGLKIIYKKQNQGKGAAIKAGLEQAEGDYILIQDADLEYNPDNYLDLLKPIIDQRAEIVFGSRNLKKSNQHFNSYYYLGGWILTKIFNFLFATQLTDLATCYKVFPASLKQQLIKLPGNDFIFDGVELTRQLVQNGLVTEVPIDYIPRKRNAGKKIKWQDGCRFLWRMLKLRFSLDDLIRGWRFALVTGLVKEGAVIADIGCGEGSWLIKKILPRIRYAYGLDLRVAPVAGLNYKIFSVNFDQAESWPITPDSIDQVFMLAVLEHLNEPQRVVNLIYRSLKNGGQLILTTPTVASKPVLEFLAFKLGVIDVHEIKDHKHYFTKQELFKLLGAAGFKEVKHKYFELVMNQLVIAPKINKL